MKKIYSPLDSPSKMASVIVDYLRDSNNISEDIEILDIGCGKGRDVLYLSKHLSYKRILGIDPNKKVINNARKSLSHVTNVEFHCIGFKKLTNDQFDVILSSNVYHFFNKSERKSFQDKINKLLKPKGIIFLSTLSVNDKQYYGKGTPVPNDPNSFEGSPVYLHFATKEEFFKEFHFLRIITLTEYFQKNFADDIEYHTCWILVGRKKS